MVEEIMDNSAFEHWYVQFFYGGNNGGADFSIHEGKTGGAYVVVHTMDCYRLWKAALSTQQQRIAELEKQLANMIEAKTFWATRCADLEIKLADIHADVEKQLAQ